MKSSIICRMSKKEVKTITIDEAKKQINAFGYPLAILFLLTSIAQYLYSYIQIDWITSNIESISIATLIILTIIFTFIIVLIADKKLDLQFKDYWINPNISSQKIFNYIILGLGILLLTTAITSMFSFLANISTLQYSFVGNFKTQENIINNILYCICFVLLKPISDEVIFRGIVQRQLGHYGRYFGVLGSAFLYALMQGNIVSAIPAFFIGWYFSLISLKYHSIKITLITSIIIHLFAFLIDILPTNLLMITTLLVLFIYIACIVILINKGVNTNMMRYGATDGKLWKILITSPSIILFIIIFIFSQIFFIVI